MMALPHEGHTGSWHTRSARPGEVGEGRRTQVSLSGPHCLWGECVLSSEAGERAFWRRCLDPQPQLGQGGGGGGLSKALRLLRQGAASPCACPGVALPLPPSNSSFSLCPVSLSVCLSLYLSATVPGDGSS